MADIIDYAKQFASIALPAAASMFGGPAAGALAKKVVDTALGVTNTNTPDEAQAALDAHPELQVQLREALLKHDEVMAEIGRQAALDEMQHDLQSYQAEVTDRDSARKREESVKDNTPAILAYLTFLLVALLIAGLFYIHIPAENANVVYLIVGNVMGCLLTCYGYYYGTTKQSEHKTTAIVDLAKGK